MSVVEAETLSKRYTNGVEGLIDLDLSVERSEIFGFLGPNGAGKTFMEAQQMAGIVVLPFVALIVVQITGLVIFTSGYVVLFSLVLIVIGYLIVSRIGPKFDREEIITTL